MSEATIHIGKVKVPLLDYAVSCTAILGIRDSGKTVTAKGIAEQLLDHHIPIVVFDAVGKWRWLKTPAPGGRGYKVVVAGGRSPDLPLTIHSVEEIVRSSIREKIPLIIDLYSPKLSKGDWRQIVQKAIRIIHYEADGVAHVFLEEAAEYVPQKVQDGVTYAEVEKLARMGGNASVGITLINQRSQEVNKAVLDLSHNLILGCQTGNRAIEAVEKWMDRLSPETAEAVTSSLPQLKSGQAWVWTRTNPVDPSLQQMPMCRSLHPDRRTPEVVLKSAQAIDTDEFVSKLKDSIPKIVEEAKANDPAELRREIVRLKRELEKRQPETRIENVEVPVLTEKEFFKWNESAVAVVDNCNELIVQLKQFKLFPPHAPTAAVRKVAGPPAMSRPVVRSNPARATSDNGTLGGGMRRMMTALAQRSPLTDKQLGVRAGMSYRSGTFGTYLAELRTNGFIAGDRNALAPTQAGIDALGSYEPLPEGQELLDYWLAHPKTNGKIRVMLLVLAQAYPRTVTDEELGEKAEISSESGTFGTYLSTLRKLELVTGKRDALKASDEFFQ